MSTENKKTPKFRVGDWVSLLYGPQLMLVQVVEDRGRLGVGGRRIYGIRLDFAPDDSRTFEVFEEQLETATESDLQAWRTTGWVGIHQTFTYSGKEKDQLGRGKPFYHYLVVARPGPENGTGIARISSLLERPPAGEILAPSLTVTAQAGGPETALHKAEEYLDVQHPGLKKVIGERRP